jgi:hypothetical protein
MKQYYFKIEGRIDADSEVDAEDKLYCLISKDTEIMQITQCEEVE